MLFESLIKLILFVQITSFIGIAELETAKAPYKPVGQVAGDRVVVEKPSRLLNQSLGLNLTAKSAIAIDNTTGKVLFEKNPDQIRSIASISKLASALVFFDYNVDFKKEMIITRAEEAEGGRLYVHYGEKITVENLFYASLVGSTNNATLALARSTGLSKQQFVEKMNQKMKDLKLNNTHFEEPTGLSQNNISTAREVVQLLNYALENKLIKKALTTKVYEFETLSGRHLRINSTDKLLGSYLNIQGGKTGYTDEAGNCFVARILGDQGQEITVVVLGTASSAHRFQEVKGISAWVFDNWQW